MLPQVFTSEALEYLPYDGVEYSPVGYNPWLRVPPRVFDETLFYPMGVFALRKTVRFSEIQITALVMLKTVRPPSWRIYVQRFDSGDGARLRTEELGAGVPEGLGLQTYYISVGRHGTLWFAFQTTKIRGFNSAKWEWTGVEYAYSHFSPILRAPFVVDNEADLVISKAVSDGQVVVHRLSTGALVRTLDVGGFVLDVFLEDTRRAYVVTETGLLVLFDYVDGRILGVTRLELQPGPLTEKRFSWDPFYRRILTLEPTADGVTGASTTVVRGYFPKPLGVAILKPIPLAVPRAGRVVPVLSRCFGDAGETISGVEISQQSTGDGTISVDRLATDALGYVRFNMECDAAGSADVDLEAEQP